MLKIRLYTERRAWIRIASYSRGLGFEGQTCGGTSLLWRFVVFVHAVLFKDGLVPWLVRIGLQFAVQSSGGTTVLGLNFWLSQCAVHKQQLVSVVRNPILLSLFNIIISSTGTYCFNIDSEFCVSLNQNSSVLWVVTRRKVVWNRRFGTT
jgi:hypothetical protein